MSPVRLKLVRSEGRDRGEGTEGEASAESEGGREKDAHSLNEL